MSMKWTPAVGTGIPFGRVIGLSAALLVGAGFLVTTMVTCRHHHPAQAKFKLVLEVTKTDDPGCYYGTAWDRDSVVLADHDASDGRRITFKHRYPFVDGCWWEGDEILTPQANGNYSYLYLDRLVSCGEDGDASKTLTCTRSGEVSAVPLD